MCGYCRANDETLYDVNLFFKKGGDYIEQWREIRGYEGYYEVSNTGKIRSLHRDIMKSDGVVMHRNPKVKIQTLNSDGYYTVKLSKDGTDRRCHVHRLVAEAFVEGFMDGLEVNHIDCDRTNNDASNLEWVTHFDNIKHTLSLGRHVSQVMNFKDNNNPNYGNRKLSKRYSEDKELSREKQSRPGGQNGRAKSIRAITSQGDVYDFEYIRQCAEFLVQNKFCSASSIPYISVALSKAARSGEPLYGCTYNFI